MIEIPYLSEERIFTGRWSAKVRHCMNDLAYSYPGARRRKKKRRSKRSSAVKLATILMACFLLAVIGARIAGPEMHSWSSGLTKPRHSPPTWLFGPIWSAFCVGMAVAAALIWRARSARFRSEGLLLFCVQISLSLAWILAFFYLHRLLVAVVFLLGL